MYNKAINYLILFITILTSISFLDLALLNSAIIKALEGFTICLLIFVNILYVIYGPKSQKSGHFDFQIKFLLLSCVLSIFAAYIWHYQSPIATIWQQRFLLLYLFYFTLKNFNIDYEFLEKMLCNIGICIAFLYVIQYLIFPAKLFDVPMRIDRGTVRIQMPGMIYHEIAFLICFNRVLNRFNVKHLIIFLFLFGVFILYGSRGTIVTCLISIILLLLVSKNSYSKYLIGFLIFCISSLVLYQFKDIFMQLIKASNQDIGSGSNYVRLRAVKYFINNFYPSVLAVFTGNGDYYHSTPYGIKMDSLSRVKGYYLSDLGIIMPFFKYGIFFIMGILVMLIRAIKMKFAENKLYIKVFIINLLIFFLFGGGYDNPGFIICFVTVLFILEKANTTDVQTTEQGS